MKKLLFILLVGILTVSCEPINDPGSPKFKDVEVDATKILIKDSGALICRYYEFTYKGHQYITNYSEKFLVHSESCPCHYGE